MFGYVFNEANGRLVSKIVIDESSNNESRSDVTLEPPPNHQPGDIIVWTGSCWTIEYPQDDGQPSLNDIKLARWSEIKEDRKRAIDDGMLFDGMRFDTDAEARSNVAGVFLRAMVADSGWTTRFTLADNTPVTLTRQRVLDLGPAVFAHVDAQHEIARGLRASILSAETAEQVASVVWPPLPST